MWVDGKNYIGPNRRSRGKSRLWQERRARGAGEQDRPSLQKMLRQLRLGAFHICAPDGLRDFQLRLDACLLLSKSEAPQIRPILQEVKSMLFAIQLRQPDIEAVIAKLDAVALAIAGR